MPEFSGFWHWLAWFVIILAPFLCIESIVKNIVVGFLGYLESKHEHYLRSQGVEKEDHPEDRGP
jgi:hypothetical protein